MTDHLKSYAAPAGRVLLALIFIVAGAQKLAGYAGTQAYMEMMGVPGGLLPLVILTELGGGLALAFGWHARTAAFLLAGFSLVSGLLFHLIPGFSATGMEAQTQMVMFMKNISIAGGMLAIIAFGPGAYAVGSRPPAALPAE